MGGPLLRHARQTLQRVLGLADTSYAHPGELSAAGSLCAVPTHDTPARATTIAIASTMLFILLCLFLAASFALVRNLSPRRASARQPSTLPPTTDPPAEPSSARRSLALNLARTRRDDSAFCFPTSYECHHTNVCEARDHIGHLYDEDFHHPKQLQRHMRSAASVDAERNRRSSASSSPPNSSRSSSSALHYSFHPNAQSNKNTSPSSEPAISVRQQAQRTDDQWEPYALSNTEERASTPQRRRSSQRRESWQGDPRLSPSTSPVSGNHVIL